MKKIKIAHDLTEDNNGSEIYDEENEDDNIRANDVKPKVDNKRDSILQAFLAYVPFIRNNYHHSIDQYNANSENNDESNNHKIYDPPMPNIGEPLKYHVLVDRNKKAQTGLRTLTDIVHKEALSSIKEAKKIPVQKELDRLTVNEKVSEIIGKVRDQKGIDMTITNNNREIQKALNIRKSVLIMMNSNYSHVLVRKIEPIQVNESRTIVNYNSDQK
eukprot:gene12652-16962_t